MLRLLLKLKKKSLDIQVSYKFKLVVIGYTLPFIQLGKMHISRQQNN